MRTEEPGAYTGQSVVCLYLCSLCVIFRWVSDAVVRGWVVFVQLLFSSEPRNSPTFATDSKYVLSTKVPIKLTSMNFEALTVRQPPVPLAGDAGQVMMPAPDGRQLPADWHQYQSERHPTPHHTTPHHTTPLQPAVALTALLYSGIDFRCGRSGGICSQHAGSA